MGWSEKYKKSIDCNNPKGFSQRAHCQGRKKEMTEEKKDHEYSMARSELKTVANAVKRLQKKMGKKGEGELKAWIQSKITKAADYIDTAADYVTNEDTVKEEGLLNWFISKSKDDKKGWVDVVDGDACAREEGETATPKCVSSKKRASMSKAERLAAQARKRRNDPNQPEKSGAAKPTYVPTDKPKKKVNEEKDKPGKGSGKKDACYHKVKARYDVWPSAYASGALVRCRKVGATNWGNKSESYEFSNWRDDFRATEYEFIDIIEAEPLVAEASFEIKHTSADVRRAEKKKKIDKLAQQGSTEGERSAAARKAGTSLPPIRKEEVDTRRAPAELVARLSARREGEMAQDGPNKPAYDAKQRILAKTKSKRMKEEVETIDELKCWKGYKRKKGAVPGEKGSCVKENQEVIEAKDETEIGITGLPIPKKKRSPKKQYEFEKKRRENLGRNVGGRTYSSDASPYKTNPRIGYLRNEYEMENELGEAKHTPTKSDLESKIGGGNLQKLSKKAAKRIDYDVDGDVDPQDKVEKKTGEYGEQLPTPFGKFRTENPKNVKVKKEQFSDWRTELEESKIDKDKMKCNEPKAQAVGDSKTGKSHVVKACESGKEKIIRFGQRGVKGSPKKEGESKAYASRRHRFKTRHAKNIAKGKMSAAYWSNVTKW